MGLSKKMEWLKWIRKYSTGILDTKTSSSMETLIDSASSKTINYAYTSPVIAADDEFINATTTAPPHRRQHQKQQEQQQQQKQQRPMLPPPASVTSQDLPANDVYDCCVSLDGIPVRHEFQYTLSDTDGCGTVTKHDIEGLASKILESVYGTTLKFSSRGQRTVKVTLNVRQTASQQSADGAVQRVIGGRESSKQNSSSYYYNGRTSADRSSPQYVVGGELQAAARCPIYGMVKGGSSSQHIRTKYRREQLIEMVQRSLAENLSFQNQRKPSKPEAIYHRPRTKRRQSSCGGSANPPSSPATPVKPAVRTPPKVAWSPYDFEPVAHVPSSYHPHHQQRQHHYNHEHQRQHQYLNAHEERQLVKNAARRQQQQQQQQLLYGGKQQTAATQAAAGGRQHHQYQQKQRAAKKFHHHIHEHHHYHHYEHYIV